MRAHRRPPEPGTVGERLALARESTGMTQEQFAEALGVARQTVINHEQGHITRVRRITLRQWALAAGTTPERLLYGDTPGGPVTRRYPELATVIGLFRLAW